MVTILAPILARLSHGSAATFPSGWKGTPYVADPGQAAYQAFMAKCVGVRNTDTDKVAEAHSANFLKGDADIGSDAYSYRSQSAIDVDVTMWQSPKLSPCLDQHLKQGFVAEFPRAAVESSVDIKPGSGGGPTNVVATGTTTIKVTEDGQPDSVYYTFTFIRGPMVKVEIAAVNVGAPVPASEMKPLVAAVATRAAKG